MALLEELQSKDSQFVTLAFWSWQPIDLLIGFYVTFFSGRP